MVDKSENGRVLGNMLTEFYLAYLAIRLANTEKLITYKLFWGGRVDLCEFSRKMRHWIVLIKRFHTDGYRLRVKFGWLSLRSISRIRCVVFPRQVTKLNKFPRTFLTILYRK